MSYQAFYDKFDYVYRGFWREYGSSCTDHLPLVSDGPWQILGIVAVYLWFVKVKGPKMMKNREAFHLKPVIFFYNMFLVILHAGLFPLGIWATDFGTSTWRCAKIDLINAENKLKENIAVLLG